MTSILIVIPTLNSYQILPSLVQSLRDQSHKEWRVLFVDGASNSAHRAWLERICAQDMRFRWVKQIEPNSGIFGAMNQGFSFAHPSRDWLLFWGSDDRAASPNVLERASVRLQQLAHTDSTPDLYICQGQYYSLIPSSEQLSSIRLKRFSRFIWFQSFRRSLFCGSSPPHQATFFGPGARRLVHQYAADLRIAADLDYFLRLSNTANIKVVLDDFNLVLMGDSGISAQKNKQRLREVIYSYQRAFGKRWWAPFIFRYIQRFCSILF
ncbi:MAG: glycosyltransferase [bacterium]|jgi:glycosyltransferase involved in cell wall biosynthesis